MSHRQSKKRSHRVRDLNLAALLDVCFLLMMFFLVTATHAADEGIIGLPLGGCITDGDDPPPPDLKLSIQASANNSVMMYCPGRSEAIGGFRELYDHLERLKRDVYGSGSPIQIRPDRSVAWEHVVNALNQVKRADFEAQLARAR